MKMSFFVSAFACKTGNKMPVFHAFCQVVLGCPGPGTIRKGRAIAPTAKKPGIITIKNIWHLVC
jgi:hypothetical protein